MASLDKHAALLGKLLENIDIAMLTTVGANGYLVSRPLSTQQATFDGERVWFFTEADSPKIGEIRRHPKVNLAYASKDKNTYVSLAGDARVTRKEEVMAENRILDMTGTRTTSRLPPSNKAARGGSASRSTSAKGAAG